MSVLSYTMSEMFCQDWLFTERYIQGSDQFMNWSGIDNQFNSIQHELNWNWIERFGIGIESLNWSELINSINSFSIQLLVLQGLTSKLQCDKQWLQWLNKQTHMLQCVPPAWGLQRSLDMKGWPLHTLRYFQWFNSLSLSDLQISSTHCPACRTSLIATRFWVVVICPIIKCFTVLEFSFLLFHLCLFITIFNFSLNYVPIVAFWIFTYHRIWILLIIFCFIRNYWIIYFLL